MSKLARYPPAVNYPFGRSSVLAAFLVAVAAGGLGGLVAWALQGVRAGIQWPVWVAMGVWLVAAINAFDFWRRQPVGTLRWDGQSWSVTVADGHGDTQARALSGPPGIFLDMQSHLWVHVSPAGRRDLWLWLERSSQPERWMDLRRAVYSRAKPGVDPDAIAPAGSRGA